MKVLFLLCFVALVCHTAALPRECYYDDRGLCIGYCEEGTHSYTTGCGPVTPEATCDNPYPDAGDDDDIVCDFSDCYCNAPTVRDTTTKKCVLLENCPKKDNVIPHQEK